MYIFTPQEDITTFELAKAVEFSLATVSGKGSKDPLLNMMTESYFSDLPDSVTRHFQVGTPVEVMESVMKRFVEVSCENEPESCSEEDCCQG